MTDALRDDLAAEHEALDDAVAALDDAGWDRPTPADGWRIRDQIGHLAYFDAQAVLAATDPDAFERGRDAALADLVAFERDASRARPRAGRVPAPHDVARRARRAARGVRRRRPGPSPAVVRAADERPLVPHGPAHGDVGPRPGRARRPRDCHRRRPTASATSPTSASSPRGWSYAVRGLEPPGDDVSVTLDTAGRGRPLDVGRRRRAREHHRTGARLLPRRDPAPPRRRHVTGRHRRGGERLAAGRPVLRRWADQRPPAGRRQRCSTRLKPSP